MAAPIDRCAVTAYTKYVHLNKSIVKNILIKFLLERLEQPEAAAPAHRQPRAKGVPVYVMNELQGYIS